MQKIRIGYPSISSRQAQLWIAKDEGLFKKYGLDVELIFLRGAQVAIQALTVVGEGQVRVYLSDHPDKPVSSQRVSGNAVMLSGDKSTIALAPAGENLLQGAGAFTSGPDMKVVVSLTFPDGKAWQARFIPGARMQGTPSVPATAPAGGHDMHRH